VCVQDVGSIAGNKKKHHLLTLSALNQGCSPRLRSRRSRFSRACLSMRWRRASRPGRAPPIAPSWSGRSEHTIPDTSPAACQPTEPASTRGTEPSTLPPATRSSRQAPATRPAATPANHLHIPHDASQGSHRLPCMPSTQGRHPSSRIAQRRRRCSRSVRARNKPPPTAERLGHAGNRLAHAAARSSRAAQHPRPRRALSTAGPSCCRSPPPPAPAATSCKPG